MLGCLNRTGRKNHDKNEICKGCQKRLRVFVSWLVPPEPVMNTKLFFPAFCKNVQKYMSCLLRVRKFCGRPNKKQIISTLNGILWDKQIWKENKAGNINNRIFIDYSAEVGLKAMKARTDYAKSWEMQKFTFTFGSELPGFKEQSYKW